MANLAESSVPAGTEWTPSRADPAAVRTYMRKMGARYWARGDAGFDDIPACVSTTPASGRHVYVVLPAWARDLGVEDPPALLVDASCVVPGEGDPFTRCDWWRAAFLHLTGAVEQAHEHRHGPIHSYAMRLQCHPALFDFAWVNRICLLLRRHAARHRGQQEVALFGALPAASIVLTHDVDAVAFNGSVRFKQGAFNLFNAARLAARGRAGPSLERLRQGARFLAVPTGHARFEELLELERSARRKALFNFFAGSVGWLRGWRSLLFDPGYDIAAPAMSTLMHGLQAAGHRIGLHPSFDSWASSTRIATQRQRLEQALDRPVDVCRQHWLRFGWGTTWAAQAAAGVRVDMTLGFNDRPGFRNGAALSFTPWDPRPGPTCIPLLFMDSHFYDYMLTDRVNLADVIARWVAEVEAVRGIATVLWHPHTLDPLYGWRAGFERLLELIGPGELPPLVSEP